MSNRLGRTIVSLLMSVLVLAWGTVPPGISHCHAGGGDAAHRHGEPDESLHDHSHPHHRDLDGEQNEHPTVPSSDVGLLCDTVVHLHMWWLGIELSFPAREDPVNNDEDQDAIPMAIAVEMDEVLPATQTGPSLEQVILAVTSTSNMDMVADLKPLLRTWVTTSIPLCDSARFERSGVLLS